MSVELLASGISSKGVSEILREKLGVSRISPAIIKYFFCSPNLDLQFRCMPSSGGLYSQRYRDFVEFSMIERKLKEIKSRRAS